MVNIRSLNNMIFSGNSGIGKTSCAVCLLKEFFRENFKNRIRQLGGSANLWANQLMMLDPLDIKDRSWIAENLSWPINYEELKIYYSAALKLLYEDYFKNVDLFNPEKNEKYISFLEKEFTKFNIFELDNSFWPGKIEKFNKNSKFTKKLLNSNNIKFIYNDDEVDAKLIESDQQLDLALLKSKVENKNYIKFSNKSPQKAQNILVAGFPFGKVISNDLKITGGIINSLKGGGNDTTRLQIDATINPGNSGGPIVDKANGSLVGVAVTKLNKDFTKEVFGVEGENTNYGIKASQVRDFLESNNLKISIIGAGNLGQAIAKGLVKSGS